LDFWFYGAADLIDFLMTDFSDCVLRTSYSVRGIFFATKAQRHEVFLPLIDTSKRK